jgi:plastocyanin
MGCPILGPADWKLQRSNNKKNMKVIKNFPRLMGSSVGTMILAHAFLGFAATSNVFVGAGGSLKFSPAVVNINTGDQIIWTWQGNFHSTTSGNGTPNGIWNSGVNNQPHSFTNSFPTAGTFPFYCSVHFSENMTGVVNVAAVAVPPTVSLTNPTNGATFSAPASFTLAATASDTSGTVTNVQFFQGATSLGNVPGSPYSVSVNNLAAADYTFSAVAANNSGLTATNAVTIHVVTAVPIVLSAPQFLPPQDFRFDYTANDGLNYIVQRSDDLSGGNWTTLGTNQASGSPVIFDDTNAPANPAFYRVGLLPNP